jgi:acyl-CoA thioesterase I
MNTAIFHFAGGDALYSGLFAVAAGAILIAATRGKRQRIGAILILLGWTFVMASAAAIPIYLYVSLGVVSVCVLIGWPEPAVPEPKRASSELAPASAVKVRNSRCCLGLGVLTLATAFIEFSRYPTQIQITKDVPIVVIGDSLSAGINDGVDVPWPACLDELASVTVFNKAKAGATCRTALNQVDPLPEHCVVIVEIGGNDLLGGHPATEFRADLEKLLAAIRSPAREVVMFELPVLPFFNGYGYAQRELAAKHNVALIPRRLLASVLFSQDATLDSIHLSNDGHRQLAEGVADSLGLNNSQ